MFSGGMDMNDTAIPYFRKMFIESEERVICIDRHLNVLYISQKALDLLTIDDLKNMCELVNSKQVLIISNCLSNFKSATFNFLHLVDNKAKQCILIPITYNNENYAILTLSESEPCRLDELDKHQLSCMINHIYDKTCFASCAIVNNVEQFGKAASASLPAQEIIKNSLMMRRTIGNLDYLVKYDTVIPHSQQIDLNQYFAHALPFVAKFVGENRIKITLTTTNKAAPIISSVDVLDLLITNIISNSYKNSESLCRFDVRTTTTINNVTVEFSDNGCGLPNINEILSRDIKGSQYYNVPTPGMGLFVIKKIAESHGASLSAKPSQSGGLSLSITFPKADTSVLLMSPDNFPRYETSFSPLFIGLSEIIEDFSATPLL